MSGISKTEWSIGIAAVVIVTALLVGWYVLSKRTPKAPPIPPEVMRVLTPIPDGPLPPAVPESVLLKLTPSANQASGAFGTSVSSNGTGTGTTSSASASKTATLNSTKPPGPVSSAKTSSSTPETTLDPAIAPLLTPDPNAAPPVIPSEVLQLLTPKQ